MSTKSYSSIKVKPNLNTARLKSLEQRLEKVKNELEIENQSLINENQLLINENHRIREIFQTNSEERREQDEIARISTVIDANRRGNFIMTEPKKQITLDITKKEIVQKLLDPNNVFSKKLIILMVSFK